ncbi:MAG: hypothetical protein KDA79_04605 [Planctomycetaceae bacterium]|nr:hypothetical protein [Planctomycetaceae bacterium]
MRTVKDRDFRSKLSCDSLSQLKPDFVKSIAEYLVPILESGEVNNSVEPTLPALYFASDFFGESQARGEGNFELPVWLICSTNFDAGAPDIGSDVYFTLHIGLALPMASVSAGLMTKSSVNASGGLHGAISLRSRIHLLDRFQRLKIRAG